MVEFLTALVLVLGVLMSAAHFPQAYRIWKRKSAGDVSLTTYIIFAAGTWVWLAYGFAIGDVPIIASFIVGVAGSNTALALKIWYTKKKP